MKSSISIACPNMIGGGAERVMDTLAMHLHSNGSLGKVYTNLVPEAATYRKNVNPLGGRRSTRKAAWTILRMLRGDNSETILLTLGFVNIAPFIRIAYPRKRIIIRIGNSIQPELDTLKPLRRKLQLFLLKISCYSATQIIAQSNSMADEIIKLTSTEAEKIKVIYNPIKIKPESLPVDFKRHPSIIKEFLEPGFIFCAASNKPQKALEDLFVAYGKYVQSGGTRHLIIAGTRADDPLARKWAQANRIPEEKLMLLGFVSNVSDFVTRSDLCVLPSRYEGFSNFLLEAASEGKRIILTRSPGGNAEFSVNYTNVDLIEVGDVMSLAESLGKARRDLPRGEVVKMLAPFEFSYIMGRYDDVLKCGSRSGFQ